jgi:hypothetical protein
MTFQKARIAFSAAGLAGGLVAALIVSFALARPALVQKTDGTWIHCRVAGVSFGRVWYTGGAAAKSRDEALTLSGDGLLGVVRIDDTVLVEFIPPQAEPDTGTPADEPITFKPSFPYAGKYKINASGFDGVLTIYCGEKGCWGTVQFPSWAKGTVEPLRRLRLNGRKISFVRSVTTPAEIKKTGSPGYFVQEYSGEFSTDGSMINGYYLKTGARYQWLAIRNKK